MTTEVRELREAERFVVIEPIAGSFGAAEIALINVGESGMMVSHPHPLRIGTRGRLSFRHGSVSAAVQARVVWSQLSKDATAGKLVYHTGLHIESRDPELGTALQTMLRLGLVRQDLDSLDRKRRRIEEREKRMASQPAMKIVSGGEPPK